MKHYCCPDVSRSNNVIINQEPMRPRAFKEDEKWQEVMQDAEIAEGAAEPGSAMVQEPGRVTETHPVSPGRRND